MELAFGLAAGLGFFLYGMKLMSEGLEKVAGAKMKNVLAMCTKNGFIGVLVGLVFTAIIQSSSASTVMVVSFVNSGLMTLTQSVGPSMNEIILRPSLLIIFFPIGIRIVKTQHFVKADILYIGQNSITRNPRH